MATLPLMNADTMETARSAMNTSRSIVGEWMVHVICVRDVCMYMHVCRLLWPVGCTLCFCTWHAFP